MIRLEYQIRNQSRGTNMDFLCVQFHSTIKRNFIFSLLQEYKTFKIIRQMPNNHELILVEDQKIFAL